MVNMATVDENDPNAQSELDRIFEKIDQESQQHSITEDLKRALERP